MSHSLFINHRFSLQRELEAIRRGETTTSGEVELIMLANFAMARLEASDLATLLRSRSGSFEDIKLYGISVQGDFSLVASALSECKHVTHLNWLKCGLSGEDLPALAGSLAQLPLLESLDFHLEHETTEGPSAYEMAKNLLVSRPNNVLRVISITDCSLVPDSDLSQFFQACQASNALEELILQIAADSPDFQATQVSSLSELLSQTNSLKKLLFCVGDNVSLDPLTESLKANESLKTLGVARAQTTQEFCSKEVSAFHATLRDKNCTLQDIRIVPWMPETDREGYVPSWKRVEQSVTDDWELSDEFQYDVASVSFFLGLNGAGRAQLMGADPTKLIEALACDSVKMYETTDIIEEDEVSAIYYYLRKNPYLFALSSASGERKRPAAMAKEDASAIKRQRKVNQDVSCSISQAPSGNPASAK